MEQEITTRVTQHIPRTGTGRRIISYLVRSREIGVLIPLVAICVIVGIVNPIFFSFYNLISISRSISLTTIIAVAMTFVLVGREIDLSVGSIVGLSGVVCGLMLVHNLPVPLAIVGGIVTGTLVGLMNGLIAVRFSIPSFIVTLGMLYAARGVVHVTTIGRPIYPLPKAFYFPGQGTILGIPFVVYVAIAFAVVGHFFLSKTIYGRHVYAVGGDIETALRAGINVNRIRVSTLVLTGFAAGVAGVLLASRLSSAQPAAGEQWELQVIASVFIGGTSLAGGSGTILGTVIGTALVGILSNVMVLMRISTYWQNIVVGAILVLAVASDQIRRREAALSQKVGWR